jgi:hypothetical protein
VSNVAALPGCRVPSNEPNEALCAGLRDLLARAESGELQSMIGTGFTSDGMRMAAWFDLNPDVYQTLGALAWLQAEYVHRHADVLV